MASRRIIQFVLGPIVLSALACSSRDSTTLDSAGVGSYSAPLRDMTAAEASEDLEQVFTLIRTLYGPYEYKQARYGYSIADLEEEARSRLAAQPGDDGFYTAANWFLTRLNDGHVGLDASPRSNPVTSYEIGILVQPVDGKALVAEVFDPSLADRGIEYGDEILSVDGLTPFEYLDAALEIDAIANDLTNEHLILRAFLRPGFSERLRPTAPTAHVVVRKADGTEFSRDLVWHELQEDTVEFPTLDAVMPALRQPSFMLHKLRALTAHAKGSLATIGAVEPFFYTPATTAAFDITPVVPSSDTLARYELDPASLPDIFAALYSYEGRSFLLIRQSSYNPPTYEDIDTYLQYYRAIMDQYDGFVDGLVVDQTHNPGGYIDYCSNFARLFTATPIQTFVEALNTDRPWINDLREYARLIDPTLSTEESLAYELQASIVEQAYDAGEGISRPLPWNPDTTLPPDESYVWTKPVIVLVDELAGSCGDAFPMLISNNHVAPLFGRRTMGLGGNVEPFGPLSNSDATLYLTRGLFTTHRDDETYPASVFVENNGVQPDIEHVISVDDFRAGFIEYMTHFSQELAQRVDAAGAPEPVP
jgi:C-terminal processing protease CtpA/Prc